VKIDVPLLFKLWNTPGISVNDVAAGLGITLNHLRKARIRYGLSLRPANGEDSTEPSEDDPTEEEIAERAAEIRATWPEWRLAGRSSSENSSPTVQQLSYDGRQQVFRQRFH
jgi:hypothetical protein